MDIQERRSMKAKLLEASDFADKIYKHREGGGSVKGVSTGWQNLDEYWNMKQGQLTVITGVPGSGKSSFLNHVILNSIALHDWHWTVFSPESWPLEDHFQSLAEIWWGKPMFPAYNVPTMTKHELDEAIEMLSASMYFIEPPEDDMKLETIEEALAVSDEKIATNAFLLDPFNELEHSRPSGMTETEYIGRVLTRLRNTGRRREIAMNIVAHPTKLQKDDNGKWPVPTMYSINGSSNWYNKVDVGVSVWRDYESQEGAVDIHIQKMRKKSLGQLGYARMYWDRPTGLFLEQRVSWHEAQGFAVRNKVRK